MLGSEDARRKLLASVLLVGGGLAFRGAGAYLQSRLGPGAEVSHHDSDVDSNDDVTKVITSPRDTPGDSVVWRGAAIMAGLETAQVATLAFFVKNVCILISGTLDPASGVEQERPEAAARARPLPLGLTLSPHWSVSQAWPLIG